MKENQKDDVKLSFKFSKIKEKKSLKHKSESESSSGSENESDRRLNHHSTKRIKNSRKNSSKSETEYVIPLTTNQQWNPFLKESHLEDGATDDDHNTESSPVGQPVPGKVIEDTGKEVADADYSQFPIQHYGLAMLRGMGYKPGSGVKSVQVIPRQKGVGLGASVSDRSYAGRGAANDGSLDELVVKKGAHCRVQQGQFQNLYATIEGIDEDNSRVIVRFAVSHKVATLSHLSIFLVSSREFESHVRHELVDV